MNCVMQVFAVSLLVNPKYIHIFLSDSWFRMYGNVKRGVCRAVNLAKDTTSN